MMIRRYIISIVLLGIGVFFLLNCGSNPVSSVEDITVTQPSSSTVWWISTTQISPYPGWINIRRGLVCQIFEEDKNLIREA